MLTGDDRTPSQSGLIRLFECYLVIFLSTFQTFLDIFDANMVECHIQILEQPATRIKFR